MAKKQPLPTDLSDVSVALSPSPDHARSRTARQALPFMSAADDGATRFWPDLSALDRGNTAQRRVAGERWALELLRYYRQFGHVPGARVLPDLLRHGVASGGAGEEQFTGLVRVLDAMLAFAARQCDLDDYARTLDAEHQRTLAAWAALDVDG
jgi:hypothetical protein